MRDPYYYDDVDVLKNLLNIKEEKQLEQAESDIAYLKILDVDIKVKTEKFDYQHLKNIHQYIFGDIYSWAGKERIISVVKGERVLGGDTVRYSYPDNIEKDAKTIINQLNNITWKELGIEETAEKFAKLIAALWQVHPFREGNTRTVIVFALQYSEHFGFKMNRQLFQEHFGYLRDAFVKASDGEYSDYHYLINFFKDAITKG